MCIDSFLVVGATGFIGQHLVNRLLELKRTVNVLVHPNEKIPSSWRGVLKIYQGDITKRESIAGICEGIGVIFHLAARVHDFSVNGDVAKEHFVVNVEGTKNILEECCSSPPRHFVFMSTIKVMAEESNSSLDESFLPNPKTPYGESKLVAEKLVSEYGEKYDFQTTTLRLPLVYGPGNKGNIYKMIAAINKRRFITVGKGENARSMVYVGNVVDAALAVINRENGNNKVYIVTDGMDYTLRELHAVIAKELGREVLPFYIPVSIAESIAQIGDMVGSILKRPLPFNTSTLNKLTGAFIVSSRKLQEEVGFKPRYNLYNTIGETIDWCKNA